MKFCKFNGKSFNFMVQYKLIKGKMKFGRHYMLNWLERRQMMEQELINKNAISNELAEEIKKLVLDARNKISLEVNETLIDTYWNIGRTIIEKEQSGKIKAEYGKSILLNVS